MTVTTLPQTIWRGAVGAGCELMIMVLMKGGNLSEKCASIKHKRPKKALGMIYLRQPYRNRS
jgi:hypothetical protein